VVLKKADNCNVDDSALLTDPTQLCGNSFAKDDANDEIDQMFGYGRMCIGRLKKCFESY
jgi:hypothetical protein